MIFRPGFRLSALDLSRLEVLKPMAYWDIAFFDWALWATPEMEALERTIHDILFPNIPFLWSDYCSEHSLDVNRPFSPKWRNSKCDVQALWSHIHHGRSVFVTSDRNFHAATKRPALLAICAGQIKLPSEAAAMLSERLGHEGRDCVDDAGNAL